MNIQKQIDNFLPIGRMIRQMPYIMVFKATNYCWYHCPHCCENSGPKQPREYIPLDAIHYYLSQAVQDPLFAGDVVFTGGEIMSAYRFGDPKYVPTLLNMCLDANISTDIKTNAGWAGTSFGKQIFKDLKTIITEHKKYGLQISLSLDNYHTNCMKNNVRVLEQLAGDRLPVGINVSQFSDSTHMYKAMLAQLRARGVRVEDAMKISPATQAATPIIVLNQSVIIQHSCGELFDGGRAKNLPGAKHIPFPQFSFLSPGHQILMAFDSAGRVTLGENSGRKISAQWKAIMPGRIWNMDAIKNMLIQNARLQELRAMIFDGWKPIR